MFEFETKVKEIKHKVLVEVVKLAREDKLTIDELEKLPYKIIPGDKAEYRCCVYKERAIVLERAKLASGYLANGDSMESQFVDIRPEKQIIYVVENACDKCPINEFTVTHACRNCLAHSCKEACKFDAISYVAGRAYINQERCKECGMCKKACQYNAISEVMRPCRSSCPTGALEVNKETRSAAINEDKCVNCGVCMKSCPFGAIEDKSLIVPVAKRLGRKRKMYAIVAPAITGQFGQDLPYGKIKNAIKSLGFEDMIEAACGADIVTMHESNEFVERIKQGEKYMTNSCCPGFLTYIEKIFPDQVKNISNTVSPMIATARYIKKKDSKAKVVFIGPCTAKKNEAVRDELKGDVDYVLTFEELIALLDGFDINIYDCKDEVVDDASLYGRGFAMAGGLTAAINKYIDEDKIDCEFSPIKISGSIEVKKTMNMAKVGRLNHNFIEGMMCEGGCINGAGIIKSGNKAKTEFNKRNTLNATENIKSNKNVKDFDCVDLERKKSIANNI